MIRLPIALAIGLLAGAVTVGTQSSLPRDQQNKQNDAAVQGGKADTNGPTGISVTVSNTPSIQLPTPVSNAQPSKEHYKPNPWWGLGASWALVIITAFLAVYAYRQWNATTDAAVAAQIAAKAAESSAKATRDSVNLTHRPKVIVRNVVLDQFADGLPASAEAVMDKIHGLAAQQMIDMKLETTLTGHYHVANIGGTPADVTEREEYIDFVDDVPMARPYDVGQAGNPYQCRLLPGESRRVDFSVTSQAPGKLATKATQTIWIYGLLRYSDEIGTVRQTAFCRFLPRGGRRFKIADNPDYEYAD